VLKKENICRKTEKGEKTKQRLFATAARLFSQYDFRQVTVDRIVEEAGVAKGTFYIYFDSKDALIAAFLSDYVSKVDTGYRAVLDGFPPEASSSEIILALVSKIAETLTDIIGYTSMKTVYKIMLTEDVDMGAVKKYERGLYQIFYDVLERGLNKGDFTTAFPLHVLSRHFVMAIRGLCYEWCIRYPDFDLKAQALMHFQILLDGIKTR
jgi:AcrR family transcriptional regulator